MNKVWTEGPHPTLEQVLQSREERTQRQKEWLKRGGTLVVLTLNMPGPCKRFPLGDWSARQGAKALRRQLSGWGFPLLEEKEYTTPAGIEYFLRVEGQPRKIKEAALFLEEQEPLGRLWDADVLYGTGEKVSRRELGREERQCLLCPRPAAECGRSRAHGLDQVVEEVHRRMKQALAWEIGAFCGACAQRALLHEVCCTPKPGLVDGQNNGAHRDMDRFTFLDSAAVLGDYFAACAREGALFQGSPEELLFRIRPLGLRAEEQMARVTKGVNTHKGAIFSLGILCAGAGRLLGEGVAIDEEALLSLAGQIARPALNDLEKQGADTAGRRFYQRSGVLGVRGQAAQGFPQVRQWGLPQLTKALGRGYSWNGACAQALCALMAHTEDTNLLHRGGEEGLHLVQQQAAALLEQCQDEQALEEGLFRLDSLFTEKNLSPGGSADLLAVTLFVYFIVAERECFDIALGL